MGLARLRYGSHGVLQYLVFRHYFCTFAKQKNYHVLPPSHTSHYLPAAGGDRPRLRVDAHRVSAYAMRLGAGRHRSIDHPQQEQIKTTKI